MESLDIRPVEGGSLLDDDRRVTECVLPGGVCAAEPDIEYMRKFLTLKGKDTASDHGKPENIVAALQSLLGVAMEADIWKSPTFRKFIGDSRANIVLRTRFKPEGPANSTTLLSDRDIDLVLEQWQANSQELFGRKFCHIPFQMIDFDKFGTAFSKLDIADLKARGYDSFGCVLNTDVSDGPGIHWFCIYGDLRTDPATIEYFNSSGRRPYEPIIAWRERKKLEALRSGISIKDVDAIFRRLQFSDTECGVWSLVYIRMRLEGKPPDWLAHKRITDSDVTSYRAQLFRA